MVVSKVLASKYSHQKIKLLKNSIFSSLTKRTYIMKQVVTFFILFSISSFVSAQNPVGASSSGTANEVASNTHRDQITYSNGNKLGALVHVVQGEIKSNNASFTQKVTANNIADFGELELSRANFKITKNQKNVKYLVRFDILKAEQVAKADEGVSGKVVGSMMGGMLGKAIGSIGTKDSAEVWVIGMRWQIINPKSGDQIGTGYKEERMELGAVGTTVMGVSKGSSGGATLDTLVQDLMQKSVYDIDAKYK